MMVKSHEDRGSPPPRGPFRRPLRVHDVPDKTGLDRRIEASPAECAAVAAEWSVPAVASLRATLHVTRRLGDRFRVTGTAEATLTQVCVVSLESFEDALRHAVDVTFALPAGAERGGHERGGHERGRSPVAVVEIDDHDDPPDLILDNTIDLGAVALEFLMLARDFYPKKPGVHFTDVLTGDKDEAEPSPFAALERFKDQS